MSGHEKKKNDLRDTSRPDRIFRFFRNFRIIRIFRIFRIIRNFRIIRIPEPRTSQSHADAVDYDSGIDGGDFA